MTVRRSHDLDGQTTAVTDHSTTVHFQTSACDLRLSPDQAARLAGHLALAAAQVRDAADIRLARGLDRLLEAIDTPEDGVRCQVSWAVPGLSCLASSTVHVTTDDELIAVCDDHAAVVEGGGVSDLDAQARHALVAIGTTRRYENDIHPPALADLIDAQLVEVVEGGPVRDRGLCVLTDAGIAVVSLLIEKKRKRAA